MFFKRLMDRIRRILLVATKPGKEEYRQSAKITGIGILVIGIIGFAIFLLVNLIGGL